MELQQERALSRARDRRRRSGGQRHSAARHADAARSRRSTRTRRSTSGWRGRRKATRSSRSRATTIAAGASGSTPSSGSPASSQSGDPKKVSVRPGEGHVVPEGHEHQRQPRAAVHRDAGRVHLRHRESDEGRAPGRTQRRRRRERRRGDGRCAAARRGATPADDTSTDRPNLVIWHYKDPRLQSQQQVQETAGSQFQLRDDVPAGRQEAGAAGRRGVTDGERSPGRGRWAIGTNNDPYELQGNLDGIRLQDIYAIDTKTGKKTVIKKGLRWGNAASPDTTKYLYYDSKNFYVFDTATGIARNITAGVPTSFVDIEDDHNVVDPPTNVVGWTSDSANVLISDRWDIWKVPVAAEAAGGEPDGERQEGSDSLSGARAHRSRTSAASISRSRSISRRSPSGPSAAATACSSPASRASTCCSGRTRRFAGSRRRRRATCGCTRRETPTEATGVYITDATLKSGRKVVDTSAEAGAVPVDVRRAAHRVSRRPQEGGREGRRAAAGLALSAGELREGQAVSARRLHLRAPDAEPLHVRPADGERLQPSGLHEQRLRGADAGHHVLRERSGHVGGVGARAGGAGGDRDGRRRSEARRAARPLVGRLSDGVHDHADEHLRRRDRRRAAHRHDQHVFGDLQEHAAARTARSSKRARADSRPDRGTTGTRTRATRRCTTRRT